MDYQRKRFERSNYLAETDDRSSTQQKTPPDSWRVLYFSSTFLTSREAFEELPAGGDVAFEAFHQVGGAGGVAGFDGLPATLTVGEVGEVAGGGLTVELQGVLALQGQAGVGTKER